MRGRLRLCAGGQAEGVPPRPTQLPAAVRGRHLAHACGPAAVADRGVHAHRSAPSDGRAAGPVDSQGARHSGEDGARALPPSAGVCAPPTHRHGLRGLGIGLWGHAAMPHTPPPHAAGDRSDSGVAGAAECARGPAGCRSAAGASASPTCTAGCGSGMCSGTSGPWTHVACLFARTSVPSATQTTRRAWTAQTRSCSSTPWRKSSWKCTSSPPGRRSQRQWTSGCSGHASWAGSSWPRTERWRSRSTAKPWAERAGGRLRGAPRVSSVRHPGWPARGRRSGPASWRHGAWLRRWASPPRRFNTWGPISPPSCLGWTVSASPSRRPLGVVGLISTCRRSTAPSGRASRPISRPVPTSWRLRVWALRRRARTRSPAQTGWTSSSPPAAW